MRGLRSQVEAKIMLPDFVEEMEKEFEEAHGWLTCEFSCSADNLAEVLGELDKQKRNLKYGSWVAFHCGKCFDDTKGAKPFHIALESLVR